MEVRVLLTNPPFGLGPAAGRLRAKRLAMKRKRQGNDPELLWAVGRSMDSGQLDGAFNRLCPGGQQEHAIHRGRGHVQQLPGELRADLGWIVVVIKKRL